MEKVTTRLEMVERLKDVRAVEIIARRGYEEDISTFRNFNIVETLRTIKSDEDEHISLLTQLIVLLEGPPCGQVAEGVKACDALPKR